MARYGCSLANCHLSTHAANLNKRRKIEMLFYEDKDKILLISVRQSAAVARRTQNFGGGDVKKMSAVVVRCYRRTGLVYISSETTVNFV